MGAGCGIGGEFGPHPKRCICCPAVRAQPAAALAAWCHVGANRAQDGDQAAIVAATHAGRGARRCPGLAEGGPHGRRGPPLPPPLLATQKKGSVWCFPVLWMALFRYRRRPHMISLSTPSQRHRPHPSCPGGCRSPQAEVRRGQSSRAVLCHDLLCNQARHSRHCSRALRRPLPQQLPGSGGSAPPPQQAPHTHSLQLGRRPAPAQLPPSQQAPAAAEHARVGHAQFMHVELSNPFLLAGNQRPLNAPTHLTCA
jgi:hypothetical protein